MDCVPRAVGGKEDVEREGEVNEECRWRNMQNMGNKVSQMAHKRVTNGEKWFKRHLDLHQIPFKKLSK